MAQSNQTVRKYVLSSAVATSLIFTPILSGSVFAKVGEEASEGDITIRETHIQEKEVALSSEEEFYQLGDVGEEVEELQRELQEQGYYTYRLDGIFGPITGQALREYEADQANGEVETMVLSETESSGDKVNQTEFSSEDVSNIRSEIVAAAKSVIGTPYVWGGTTPEGMDSSGFINYVMNQVGVDDVSRTHRDMWANNGNHVDRPSIGDLVFFEGTYNTAGASHSGVYIGDNQMIHAGNDGVRVADISIDYWQNHYIGAKSFID